MVFEIQLVGSKDTPSPDEMATVVEDVLAGNQAHFADQAKGAVLRDDGSTFLLFCSANEPWPASIDFRQPLSTFSDVVVLGFSELDFKAIQIVHDLVKAVRGFIFLPDVALIGALPNCGDVGWDWSEYFDISLLEEHTFAPWLVQQFDDWSGSFRSTLPPDGLSRISDGKFI